MSGVTLGHQIGEDAQPGWLLFRPTFPRLDNEGLGHSLVPTHHSGIEQAESGSPGLVGHLDGLAGSSDTVVKSDSLVPDRIPDLVSGGRDVPAPTMEQHHV